MDSPTGRKPAHELLSDAYEHTRRLLIDYGVAEDVADQAAAGVYELLAEHWGGQNIVFPKDHAAKIAARDLAMYADFSGHNHAQLVRKYGVCLTQVYRIIKRVQKAESARRQSALF